MPATDGDSVPGRWYEAQTNELSFVDTENHHKTPSNFASSCLKSHNPPIQMPRNQQVKAVKATFRDSGISLMRGSAISLADSFTKDWGANVHRTCGKCLPQELNKDLQFLSSTGNDCSPSSSETCGAMDCRKNGGEGNKKM